MHFKIDNCSSGAFKYENKYNHAMKQLKFWAMCNKDVRLIDTNSQLTVVWYYRYPENMDGDWVDIDEHGTIFLWAPCFDWRSHE
jgi:hypothetical protein